MAQDTHSDPPSRESARAYWYGVLSMFPFFYLPLVALICLILAFAMPILTNARR